MQNNPIKRLSHNSNHRTTEGAMEASSNTDGQDLITHSFIESTASGRVTWKSRRGMKLVDGSTSYLEDFNIEKHLFLVSLFLHLLAEFCHGFTLRE
ncbi:unnamed protein product [Linum tenue]|uniref:Uncharacterized protein n=1 Tax=Linum tenue TaxID=586396 RepID=A0AAV0HNP2_9ROSI|nr:unnamed protein product [Linum tenue]